MDEITVPEGVYHFELREEDLIRVLRNVRVFDAVLFYLGLNYPFAVHSNQIREFLMYIRDYKSWRSLNVTCYMKLPRALGLAARERRGWYRITKKGLQRLKWLHYVERALPKVPAVDEVKIRITKKLDDGRVVEIEV